MAKTHKKRRKPYNVVRYPVIGKYIDTPTKAELEVVYFVDEIGEYKVSVGDLPVQTLPGCRFQLRLANIKAKRKFFKKLKPFLLSLGSMSELSAVTLEELPLLFGLLKLRKKKQRILVWIKSADAYYKSKVITIGAAVVDNLLYLDLITALKEKP